MAAPQQDFGHGGNVRHSHEPQEGDHDGFRKCDGSKHQHAQRRDSRHYGELSADTHVAHGINHPRGRSYFST
jgi:hypothetical protein